MIKTVMPFLSFVLKTLSSREKLKASVARHWKSATISKNMKSLLCFIVCFILVIFRKEAEIAINDSGEAYQNQQRSGKERHHKLKGILEFKSTGHDVNAVNQQNYRGN